MFYVPSKKVFYQNGSLLKWPPTFSKTKTPNCHSPPGVDTITV